jgi:ABC-type transporter Mla MlaB component
MHIPDRARPVLLLVASPSRHEVGWMCERIRALLGSGRADRVVCDVTALRDPDAGTVEALARMQLSARRMDGRVELRGACNELRDLLRLSGLTDVLPCEELSLETRRQTEEGEEPGGIEEERDPADPVA